MHYTFGEVLRAGLQSRLHNTPAHLATSCMLLLILVMTDSATSSSAAINDPSANITRVRREDRWVSAEQPAAEYSDKRAPSQSWCAYVVGAELPGGGKNPGRKKATLGPYKAATKDAAEAKRARGIDE